MAFKPSFIKTLIIASLCKIAFGLEQLQAAFSLPSHRHQTTSLLDGEFESWLNKTGHNWGMKGVSIAITRRQKDENGTWGDWETELKGYGIADRWGAPVTEDVCISSLTLELSFNRSIRLCFPSGRIPNFFAPLVWVCLSRMTLIQSSGIPKLGTSCQKGNGFFRTNSPKNTPIL